MMDGWIGWDPWKWIHSSFSFELFLPLTLKDVGDLTQWEKQRDGGQ